MEKQNNKIITNEVNEKAFKEFLEFISKVKKQLQKSGRDLFNLAIYNLKCIDNSLLDNVKNDDISSNNLEYFPLRLLDDNDNETGKIGIMVLTPVYDKESKTTKLEPVYEFFFTEEQKKEIESVLNNQ